MGTSDRLKRCVLGWFVLSLGLVFGACAPAPPASPPEGETTASPPQRPTAGGPSTPTVTVPAATSEPLATGTAHGQPPPSADGARWIGQWTSAACGARTYERWLDLAADGSATGSDRVSPCPTGRTCVWSGIVPWAGTWQGAGETVTLSVAWRGNPAAAARLNLPKQLVWNQAAAGPAEMGSDTTCRYRPRSAPKPPTKH
ncbi:MAG: hypothetical protein JRI68_16170 [Deltaproteobacteria bacterium]|nr:hypothetical protein [Deltaproteobacteria bacterium]